MAARADGTYLRLLQRLAKAKVLIIDDLGIEPLGAPERKHRASRRKTQSPARTPRYQPRRENTIAAPPGT